MKPSPEIYEKIPSFPKGNFMHLPGVYCQGCGEDYALYFYSAFGHYSLDENGKPFYKACPKCQGKDWIILNSMKNSRYRR
jgi:hypothetical protein